MDPDEGRQHASMLYKGIVGLTSACSWFDDFMGVHTWQVILLMLTVDRAAQSAVTLRVPSAWGKSEGPERSLRQAQGRLFASLRMTDN